MLGLIFGFLINLDFVFEIIVDNRYSALQALDEVYKTVVPGKTLVVPFEGIYELINTDGLLSVVDSKFMADFFSDI